MHTAAAKQDHVELIRYMAEDQQVETSLETSEASRPSPHWTLGAGLNSENVAI